MPKKILKILKPLSTSMEEQLMELHERDLLCLEPSLGYLNRTSTSLFRRGLVELKEYTIKNKRFYAFHITPLGIYYLSEKCKSCFDQ